MKGLRYQTGGPAYLKKLRELNPSLASGVEKLRSQFKGENLAKFDRRGGYQFAAYQNMPEEQQKAFIEDMASKYSSPDEGLIAETKKVLVVINSHLFIDMRVLQKRKNQQLKQIFINN